MDIVWETPANPPQARDYIIRKGRRYVRPYYFEFISHVKNRWAGKNIVDLFAQEFKGRHYDYYVEAVKSGRIQVDGQIVHMSYVVQSSQKISHFLHRHEPPVLAGNVMILQSESDVVTVCKPASIPVHPCGQYRKNTVVGILQAEHGLAPLFPVHRLDRLVSGLLIFARNAKKADSFRQQIEGGLLQKEYVAKVVGVFPEGELAVNANVNYDGSEGRSTIEVDEEFTGQPLKGKVACTKFMRISTNGTHSVVLCKPVTGRTHQIRVHLQYAGHPIANDALYLSNVAAPRSTFGTGADRAASAGMDVPQQQADSAENGLCHDVRYGHSDDEFRVDPMCTNCPDLAPKGSGKLQSHTATRARARTLSSLSLLCVVVSSQLLLINLYDNKAALCLSHTNPSSYSAPCDWLPYLSYAAHLLVMLPIYITCQVTCNFLVFKSYSCCLCEIKWSKEKGVLV